MPRVADMRFAVGFYLLDNLIVAFLLLLQFSVILFLVTVLTICRADIPDFLLMELHEFVAGAVGAVWSLSSIQ